MANFYSKKVCRFCAEKLETVDYKDVKLLQRYVSMYGKLKAANGLVIACDISAG